jgi:hypothetical protein
MVQSTRRVQTVTSQTKTRLISFTAKTLVGLVSFGRRPTNWLAGFISISHTRIQHWQSILTDYILSRDSRRLDALELPSQFHQFAFSQDMIGWDNFMLRKISMQHLGPIQHSHLLCSPSMLTVDDWMKRFIDQLLHIVDGQWIYRNVSKHHETLDSIQQTERHQLLLEIDRLASLQPEEVPEESKFLLEVDFARMVAGDVTVQHYWVNTVKAALVAGRRRTFLAHSQRSAPSGRCPVLTERPPIPYSTTDNTSTAIGLAGLKRSHGGSGSLDDKSNKRHHPD